MGFEVIDYINRKKADMYALCEDWAGTLGNEAKINASWKDRSSHARQYIHGGIEMIGNNYNIYLAHGMDYGTFLETGTGLYGPKKAVIKPKNKKALYWKDAAHPMKEIKGMKPMPVIEPTLRNNLVRIKNTVIDHWSD